MRMVFCTTAHLYLLAPAAFLFALTNKTPTSRASRSGTWISTERAGQGLFLQVFICSVSALPCEPPPLRLHRFLKLLVILYSENHRGTRCFLFQLLPTLFPVPVLPRTCFPMSYRNSLLCIMKQCRKICIKWMESFKDELLFIYT